MPSASRTRHRDSTGACVAPASVFSSDRRTARPAPSRQHCNTGAKRTATLSSRKPGVLAGSALAGVRPELLHELNGVHGRPDERAVMWIVLCSIEILVSKILWPQHSLAVGSKWIAKRVDIV